LQSKACEVCGKHVARYVCQECGREVCELCFESSFWVCSSCYERLGKEAPRIFPWSIPLKLFLLGFILIFIGVVLMVIAAVFSGAYNVGAVVFIGPIPIILGAGPQSFLVIMLAVALTILGVILFFAFFKEKEKS
jgi:uncharacterized membrane protein